MNVLLTTLNTKYIHKALALRWLYVTRPTSYNVDIKEFTINEKIEKIVEKMNLDNYDVIGLSVYIWNSTESKELIRKIKEIKPNIRIILGGPDVTFDNDDWFDLPIEAICIGEGEKAFWQYLLEGYSSSVKCSKGEQKELARVDLKWLETFENPYFLDFDLQDMDKRYLYLETSRGCPYGCKFCLSETDRNVRCFSDEYLDKIFNKLNDYHLYQVKFLDRTFNLNPGKALKFIKKLNDIKSVDSFQMELVAETLPEEVLQYMETEMDKERFRFEVGVQSFNEETLKAVHRISNLEKLSNVIKRLVKSNIVVHSDLIAGLPYEDLNSFRNSFDTLFKLQTAEVQCGTLKLLKGTALRKEANDLHIYYEDKSPYEVIKTKWLSEEDMGIVHMVALGCEKSYNNQRLSYTLEQLFKVSDVSPFDLFYKIGVVIENLPRPYQLVQYFTDVYEVFKDYMPIEQLKGVLLVDYYKNTQTKPKILFEKEDNSEIYEFLYKTKKFNEYVLQHYSVITSIYKDGKKYHQLLIYHDRVEKAERYLIDIEKKIVEEF